MSLYLLNPAACFTIMNERRPEDRHIIDFTLAHVPKYEIQADYNRALYIKQRADILQEWADLFMDGQSALDDVVKLPRRINKAVDL